jgi:hypothetical protein
MSMSTEFYTRSLFPASFQGKSSGLSVRRGKSDELRVFRMDNGGTCMAELALDIIYKLPVALILNTDGSSVNYVCSMLLLFWLTDTDRHIGIYAPENHDDQRDTMDGVGTVKPSLQGSSASILGVF